MATEDGARQCAVTSATDDTTADAAANAAREAAPRPMKIVVLCGSLREGSYTAMALRPVVRACEEAGAEITHFPLHDLPFSDARKGGWPPCVDELRAVVTACDGLLIGTPEYHNSCSGVLKNALDLLSADHLADKVCGLLSVAGGASAMSSLSHLRIILRAVHAWVIPQQVMLPEAWRQFDADGALKDPKILERCQDLGRRLAIGARRLQVPR